MQFGKFVQSNHHESQTQVERNRNYRKRKSERRIKSELLSEGRLVRRDEAVIGITVFPASKTRLKSFIMRCN